MPLRSPMLRVTRCREPNATRDHRLAIGNADRVMSSTSLGGRLCGRRRIGRFVIGGALLGLAAAGGGHRAVVGAPASVESPTQVRPAVVGRAATPSGRTEAGSLVTPDGRTRTYRVYVGSGLPAGPIPLLLAFHGGGGSGAQFQANSGFDRLAESDGFLVVYPDGVGADAGAFRTWNGGVCCGPAARLDVDDVGFVGLLIEELRGEYSIDDDRVYATGHSNGAILVYRLACEMADQLAAVGFQAGDLEIDVCAPAAPVSLIHLHGAADRNLPIDGGVGPDSISGVEFRSARFSMETFAEAVGCDGVPQTSVEPDNADVSVTEWTNCDGGVEVRLLAVTGASHTWMGSPPRPGAAAPYPHLDASSEIWEFLAAHPRCE